MTVVLERRGRSLLLLGSGCWIVTKQFTACSSATPQPAEMLEALLEHPAYRDDFASPEGETELPIHGPYRLDAVTADAFAPISLADAEGILTTWLHDTGVRPEDFDPKLMHVFERIRAADIRFYLGDLGEASQHDWGWVVGMTGFHEFVLVGPGEQVNMIVASDD